MPDRQKRTNTRATSVHVYWRIDFDRLRRLPSSLTSAIVVPLIKSNWALISARMDVLIVTAVGSEKGTQ